MRTFAEKISRKSCSCISSDSEFINKYVVTSIHCNKKECSCRFRPGPVCWYMKHKQKKIKTIKTKQTKNDKHSYKERLKPEFYCRKCLSE